MQETRGETLQQPDVQVRDLTDRGHGATQVQTQGLHLEGVSVCCRESMIYDLFDDLRLV